MKGIIERFNIKPDAQFYSPMGDLSLYSVLNNSDDYDSFEKSLHVALEYYCEAVKIGKLTLVPKAGSCYTFYLLGNKKGFKSTYKVLKKYNPQVAAKISRFITEGEKCAEEKDFKKLFDIFQKFIPYMESIEN